MEFVFLLGLAFVARTAVPVQDELAAQIEERIAEFDSTYDAWYQQYLASEGSRAVMQAMPDPAPCGKRVMELAAEAPDSDAAARACGWVMKSVRGGEPLTAAVTHVLEHLPAHAQIAELARAMLRAADYLPPDLLLESLRWILDQADSTELGARACYQLAAALKYRVLGQQAPEEAQLLEEQADGYFERCTSEPFASVLLHGDITIGEAARADVFEMKNLRIGKTAPEIAGEDLEGVAFELGDYRGKVVMLSFWGDW